MIRVVSYPDVGVHISAPHHREYSNVWGSLIETPPLTFSAFEAPKVTVTTHVAVSALATLNGALTVHWRA